MAAATANVGEKKQEVEDGEEEKYEVEDDTKSFMAILSYYVSSLQLREQKEEDDEEENTGKTIKIGSLNKSLELWKGRKLNKK